MWQPWSRPLEILGEWRLYFASRKRVRVGSPNARDAQESWAWKNYVDSEKLYDVWGPAPDGPWMPFHCVPLFAALDRITRSDIGPTAPPNGQVSAPGAAHPRFHAPPPRWLTPDTLTIIDMPGPSSVAHAAWLINTAGCQPVCTFDNWPHHKGLLKAEQILGELLRWASAVADARPRITRDSPPLWICDNQRLGTRAGSPGEFDNRYYLDDSILPGIAILRQNGIRQVVYVTMAAETVPVLDLEYYFADLLAAGITVLHHDLIDPTTVPRPLAAPATPRRPPRAGYRRSAAGGFGTEVPQPSEGGSSGG